MEQILQQIDITQVLIFAATALCGGLGVWYRSYFVDWVKSWRDIFNGLRSLPEMHADVKGIRFFVAPNGGGSLMDSVSRTERTVRAITEQIDLMIQTARAENDSDDDVGRYHCDASGAVVYVNQIYARWLGVGKAELLGWHVFNFIHAEDTERVRQHWELCRSERRQYHVKYRVVSTGGEIFEVETTASPIPEAGEVKRWIGAIRRLDHDRRCVTGK